MQRCTVAISATLVTRSCLISNYICFKRSFPVCFKLPMLFLFIKPGFVPTNFYVLILEKVFEKIMFVLLIENFLMISMCYVMKRFKEGTKHI